MKKRLEFSFTFIVALLLLFSANLSAQNMHVIGTGTIESHYPPNNIVFEYGWSSMLYTSDEVGEAKTITKIAFDQTTDYSGYWEYAVLENQKVYIKQADISNYTSLVYEDPNDNTNGYTLIFDGTIQFNLGWTQIELAHTFDYDGTSGLIVHWENHRATSAPVINVKFNASPVTENVFKALGGDGSFPTSYGTFVMDRPNLAIYSNGDGPATPINPLPANNSLKALVDTELEFLIGGNTNSYNVYFGTTNPPTELILEDAVVTTSGTYSCNPSEIMSELLLDYTDYFWQIEAKDNAGISALSEVWKFKTQGVIDEFPYFTSFEDSIINPMYADTIDWSWPISGVTNWRMMDYGTHSGLLTVACNAWSANAGSYSLVTPRMYLPENQRVNFWWRIDGGDLVDINVFFEITVNGGQNWELLKQFNPEQPSEEYEQELIDLGSYSGNNVYLRWRYETMNSWVADHFFLDDLLIEDAPDGAVIQIEEPQLSFPSLSIGGSTYLPLEVTNVGSVDLYINGSTIALPYGYIQPGPIVPGESEIVMITMAATTVGDFNQTYEFTGDFTGDAEFNLVGSVYQPTYNFFENADIGTELPVNWTVIRTLDPYDIFTDVTVKTTAYDAYSAPNVYRMMKMNDTISPLMFLTEGVGGYGANKLTFYAKKSYDDYDAILQVGTTTDPLHAELFIPLHDFVMTTEFQKFEMEFPVTTTDPYVAFKFLEGRYASVIWIDDIEWDMQGSYPPYCPNILFPAANATDVDIMTSLELKWTSGGGNPIGYKLFLGTDPDATNILNGEDVGTDISYTFSNIPAYSTQLYWRVDAYNSFGESTGCGINNFTIMDNPVVMIPFSENFDGLDAFGNRDYPLGWSIENANNDNFPWDLISNLATPDIVHSAPNAMHMLFSLNSADDYLFTPPVKMEAGTVYELSFWYKTMGDQWVPNPVEHMTVLIGYNNNSEAMITEIYKNENIDNLSWIKAKVTYSVETDGEYFLGFYDFSQPNQGLLLLDDVEIISYASVNENKQNILTVYPNPAVDKIHIVSKEDIENVKIFSVGSNMVYQYNFNVKTTTIGLDALDAGIYIICIETENEVVREKLIVR